METDEEMSEEIAEDLWRVRYGEGGISLTAYMQEVLGQQDPVWSRVYKTLIHAYRLEFDPDTCVYVLNRKARVKNGNG